MYIKCLSTGMFGSNSYIIGNNGLGAVIDAGVDAAEIADEAQKAELEIKYIILTHAHIDHIAYGYDLKKITEAELFIHEEDAPLLKQPRLNGSILIGTPRTFDDADILLKDGQILRLGETELEIIHTPGHTPGGICIKAGDSVFTGDTLFQMSIGRTDLGAGNYIELMNSIREKLLRLDDNIVVYPGHGPSTTIGIERKCNPYINGEMHGI